MSRPTVEQLDFPDFKRALERAVAAGTRIVPGEKQRWNDYVTTHAVRETNFQAYARGRYPDLQPVIIDEAAPWGGYYMWSLREEIVLRWQRTGD